MSSRALTMATVMFSFVCGVNHVQAQNLEAGKSPAQIFGSSCAVCHRSQRGLLKTIPPNALPGFLREHYTTSRDMAAQLSAYLLSSSAPDARGARPTRQRQNARSGVQGEPLAEPETLSPGRGLREAQPSAGDGLGASEPQGGRKTKGRAARQARGGGERPPKPVVARERKKLKASRRKGYQQAPGKEVGKEAPAPAEATRPLTPEPAATDQASPAAASPAAAPPAPTTPAVASPPPAANSAAPEPARPAQGAPASEPAPASPPRSDPVPSAPPAAAVEPLAAPEAPAVRETTPEPAPAVSAPPQPAPPQPSPAAPVAE